MKIKSLLFIFLLFPIFGLSQGTPINYKALIKDDLGNVVANQSVTVQLTVFEGAAMSTSYSETHNPTTDANGLVILNIGQGTPIVGTYNAIAWGSDEHHLNVQVDIGGGLVDMGTTQFMAVPYAISSSDHRWEDSGTHIFNDTQPVNIGSNLAPQGQVEIQSNSGVADTQLTLTETEDDYSRLNYRTANGDFYWTLAGLTQPLVEDDRFNVYSSRGGNILMMKGDGRVGVGADPRTPFHVGDNRRVLFGADTINGGPKLMFLPDKFGAFRAGRPANIQWNGANIGQASTAFGNSTEATASYSFAAGSLSVASGFASFAMGDDTEASGSRSTAFGEDTRAIGSRSSAFGLNTDAFGTAASSFGIGTEAQAYASSVFGRYNSLAGDSSSWIETDPLFEVGNGTDNNNRNNAFLILKNGTITAPTFDLAEITDPKALTTKEYVDLNASGAFETNSNVTSNIPGDPNTDDFVFGSLQLADDTDPLHDNRMFFDKSKGAFRSGTAEEDQWDDVNVGNRSFSIGSNNIASGAGAGSFGIANTSSHTHSITLGAGNDSSGFAALAMGLNSISSGYVSFAAGNAVEASANGSSAFGFNTKAEAQHSAAFGRFNIGGGSPTTIVPTDPLFEVGNGDDDMNRSNALTILKNGTITAPSFDLVEITDSKALTTKEYVDMNSGGAFSTTSNMTSNAPGNYANDNFVFGSPQMDYNGNPVHVTRMFFNKAKGAFRAGASITDWDDASVGIGSMAAGRNALASGDYSLAVGDNAEATADYAVSFGLNSFSQGIGSFVAGSSSFATGDYSACFGFDTLASGFYSFAAGLNTDATGSRSTALGQGTVASGANSFAVGSSSEASGGTSFASGFLTDANGNFSFSMGDTTSADAYASVVLGRFNIGGGNPNSWITTDPLLEVGIGASSGSKNNAFTVLKNGKSGFGTHTPRSLLEVSHVGTAPSVSDFTNAFTIANESSNDSWQFYTQNDGYLLLYKDGNYRGSFNEVSGVYGPVSDRKLKTNIESLGQDDVDLMMKLKPVKYNMIDQTDSRENFGLIAQELQEIFPDMVYQNESSDLLSVSYNDLIPVLIKAVQEQQDEIESLKKELEEYKKLEDRLSALELRINN